VLTLAEALEHPHNVARGSYTTVGEAMLAAPTPRFSLTQGHAGPETEVGAATVKLLAELGYTNGDLNSLRESGTIS
jgi:alpha-methylacyl-CoA racemase